jgi:hypothetical protein
LNARVPAGQLHDNPLVGARHHLVFGGLKGEEIDDVCVQGFRDLLERGDGGVRFAFFELRYQGRRTLHELREPLHREPFSLAQLLDFSADVHNCTNKLMNKYLIY